MPTLGSVLHEKLILSHPLILCAQCTSNIYLEWKKEDILLKYLHTSVGKKKTRPWCSMLLFCFASKDEILIYINFCRNTKKFFTAFIPQTFCFFSSFEKKRRYKKEMKGGKDKKGCLCLSQVTPPALPKRELILVSTAWTDEECYYSPLDWMPVHQKATPPPPQLPRISSGFYDNFLVSINSWFEKAYWNKGARSTSGLVVVTEVHP